MDDEVVINDERCRRIGGFEKYHISESGRIYRTETRRKKHGDTEPKKKVTENKVHFRTDGNRKRNGLASLTDADGVLHCVDVPSLVAIAFDVVKGKLNKRKSMIAFKDDNRKNLHYTNLLVKDRVKINGKLTLEDVKQIKKHIRKGVPLRRIAYFFSVSEMQINRIKTGENWGNGKRKIKAPKAPFEIEDGRMRKYIATFDREETTKGIKKRFTVKRNSENPTDNTIVGIVKGYKLSLKHSNITRATEMVEKLNKFFFEHKVTQGTLF